MDLLLFDREKYDRLYNCSFYSVDQIPFEERQHGFMGLTLILAFIVFETLYVLCLLSIRKHLSNSCYKFMFYIGIADFIQLWNNALLCGCWMAESTGAVFLAFSRCLEVWSPYTAKALLKGNRAWMWLIAPTLLSVYAGMYTTPVVYSGKFYSVFFNPHIGYIDEITPADYHNTLHAIHNVFLVVSLVGIYFVFCILLLAKLARGGRKIVQDSFKHKSTFLQVALISLVNATASGIYVVVMYVYVSPWIIILGHYSWLLAHGMPAVIYLTTNSTIQRDVKRMFLGLLGNPHAVSSIYPSDTQQKPSEQARSSTTH
ncbi:Protein SRT-24 [Aphelenchoides avenae]|nr:Protein SRT-24 [Aphelenchus avenae]